MGHVSGAGQAIVKYIEVGVDWLLEHAGDIALGTLATLLGAAVGSAITGVLAKRSLHLEQVRLAGVARNEAYLALRIAREAGDDQSIAQAIKGLRQARAQVDKVWMQNLPKGGSGTKIANWLAKSPKICGAIGGTLVAIAFTIASEIVMNLVNKDLFVNVRMYNWTSEQWTVQELYTDNAIIVGKTPFVMKVMPATSRKSRPSYGYLRISAQVTIGTQTPSTCLWERHLANGRLLRGSNRISRTVSSHMYKAARSEVSHEFHHLQAGLCLGVLVSP